MVSVLNKMFIPAVAQHLMRNGHNIEKSSLKLLKAINSLRELDAYESLYISNKYVSRINLKVFGVIEIFLFVYISLSYLSCSIYVK